jgi:phytoene dehydrogenase-like protein
MGGLCRISHAFAEVSRAEDAEIQTSEPVARVLLDGRRAIGVELASGEKVHCDDVIINADFGHAMATLFDDKSIGRYKTIKAAQAEVFVFDIHDVSGPRPDLRCRASPDRLCARLQTQY